MVVIGIDWIRVVVMMQVVKGDVYCFCRKGEFGQMIACDNLFCPYKWFHFSCVNITSEPDGNWFCSSCK